MEEKLRKLRLVEYQIEHLNFLPKDIIKKYPETMQRVGKKRVRTRKTEGIACLTH